MNADTPETTVPILDLAPKRDKPLSLLNPLDYLLLLYWVFFFPQALRWYVETFAAAENEAAGEEQSGGPLTRLWRWLRQKPIQRNLFLQGQIANLAATVVLLLLANWLLAPLGIEVNVAFGVAVGVAFGVAVGVAFGAAGGVAFGVAFGVADGLQAGVAVADRRSSGFGVSANISSSIAVSVLFGVVFGAAAGVVFGLAEGTSLWPALRTLPAGMLISGGVTYLFSARLFDRYISRLRQRIQPGVAFVYGRMNWYVEPRLVTQLHHWLKEEAAQGLRNANQLLAYTLQFQSVSLAINRWLAELPDESLLAAVDQVAAQPFDWKILLSGSASIPDALKSEAIRRFFLLPNRGKQLLRQRMELNSEPSQDTPAQAACIGYWYLHRRRTNKAAEAFAVVRVLPHGDGLFRSAKALDVGRQCESSADIAAWAGEQGWLRSLAEPLRPGAIATLNRLQDIALDVALAEETISRHNRSAALGRAGANLTRLINDVEDSCPYPEWPIVKEIAIKWRDIVSLAGGEAGELAIRERVPNPFVVGNPVQGQLFVGRQEIFQELLEEWGEEPGQPVNSIVLYGHRRMGKTSILQNLAGRFGAQTLITNFSMQRAGRLQGTGEFLFFLALAISDTLRDADLALAAEPELASFTSQPYLAFNRYLRQVRARLTGYRLILAIDEFEEIENAISAGQLDEELLDYIRGVIHDEPWLILILAGLHTLREMTQDYWNPLFASVRPLKVSFLSRGMTAELLGNPGPDFPLGFSQASIDRVYELVAGQPYLTQLIGYRLVRAYNQAVFEDGTAREPNFTPADIDAVIADDDFYQTGSYYFKGIWSQAEGSEPDGQIQLLKTLAASDTPLSPADLFIQAGVAINHGQQQLQTLANHDVISQHNDQIDFTVPLLRTWIRRMILPPTP